METPNFQWNNATRDGVTSNSRNFNNLGDLNNSEHNFVERDFISSLIGEETPSNFNFYEFFGIHPETQNSNNTSNIQANETETLENYLKRTSVPLSIPSDYIPSIEDVYRPLSNATSIFPHLKKDPYDPNLFSATIPNPPANFHSPTLTENGSSPLNSDTSNGGGVSPSFYNYNQVSHPFSSQNTLSSSSPSFPSAALTISNPATTNKRKCTVDSSKPDRPSKRQKTAEEKEELRAQQQRQASKRYRKKKKALIEQLEIKLKALTDEKFQIELEHKQTIEMVNKLKQENASLRKNHYQDSEIIEKERIKNLALLDELIRKGASDEELLTVLVRLKECCKRISLVGEWQGQMLITPGVVSQLVKTGFFEKTFTTEEASDTVNQFVSKVFATVPSLTPAQRASINKLTEDHFGSVGPIKAEREELNKELTKFFLDSNSVQSKKENDMPKLLQIMSTLEYLRKNLSEEIQKVDDTLSDVMWILTPRQQAKFYLEAEFQHKSVQQLKLMWDAMKSSLTNNNSKDT